jgi:MoxR-like ATPase
MSKIIKDWEAFEMAVKNLRTVFVWGPPGLGKTTAAQDMLDVMLGMRATTVTMNEDWVVQELLGHYLPGEDGAMHWHNGPVTEALRGGSLVVNELARASGAVLDAMLSVMDGQRVARIALPNGEMLTPHAGFRVISTSNSDVDNLDPALRDRFEATVHIKTPHPAIVAALNEGLPKLGDVVLRSYSDGDLGISVRQSFTFLKLLSEGPGPAGQLAYGDRWGDIAVALKLRDSR